MGKIKELDLEIKELKKDYKIALEVNEEYLKKIHDANKVIADENILIEKLEKELADYKSDVNTLKYTVGILQDTLVKAAK